MSPRIYYRRSIYGLSVLEIRDPETTVEIKVLSLLGKRERRALLRVLFRQIRPYLKDQLGTTLDHSPDGNIRNERNRQRGLQEFSRAINPAEERLGFEIRMKRLKLGLTQAQLAARLGLRRSHLSELERGLHRPRPQTRERITDFLISADVGNEVRQGRNRELEPLYIKQFE
jgi:DNA-binding transcriptional regulator YiaG